jgi:hypothetical protein
VPDAAFVLSNNRSLYDALGPDYTLIRFDSSVRVEGFVKGAADRAVPLTMLDIEVPGARDIYTHKLLLVRPDQHVAWRGHAEPAVPEELIDLVRGARTDPLSMAP